MFKFGWVHARTGSSRRSARAAAELARNAHVAVVVARDYSSEGGDRPNLDLPNGQDELIRQVAAANPRTIVVSSPPARASRPPTGRTACPAILQTWYGGQEQGNAHRRHPVRRREPVRASCPSRFPSTRTARRSARPEQSPGIGLDQQFSEGIFVGYRGYEECGIEPQYPFGHGLSYTRSTTEAQDLAGRAEDGRQQLKVRVTVRNTGTVAGTRDRPGLRRPPADPAGAETAAKALAGWAQVDLQPGERKKVTVTLSPESLSYWDVDRDRWRTPSGDVPLFVGSSSDDIRLTGTCASEATPCCPDGPRGEGPGRVVAALRGGPRRRPPRRDQEPDRRARRSARSPSNTFMSMNDSSPS